MRDEFAAAYKTMVQATQNDLDSFFALEGVEVENAAPSVPLEDVLAATRLLVRLSDLDVDPEALTDVELLDFADGVKGDMLERFWFHRLDDMITVPEQRARVIAFIESRTHRPLSFT